MDCEYLKSVIDRQISDWMEVKPHKMTSGDEVIRVTLPLLEPDGDVLCLYVAEREDGLVIHDGGHIGGLLFGIRRDGPTEHDREVVVKLIDHHGLKRDQERGLVFVETDEGGLRFWLLELGWVVALIPFLVLPSFPTEQGMRAKNERTARAVSQRLQETGLEHAIERDDEARGASGRDWRIDFSYVVPATVQSEGKLVRILALDLDVPKPLEEADKTIAAALDLLGAAITASRCEYGVVYGVGNNSWAHHPAALLLAAISEHSPLSTYCWDDVGEQERFMERLKEDLLTRPLAP